MKLRLRFSSHQLLFAVGLSLFFAAGAAAQDKITTRDGRVQDVKILGMAGSSVQVQVGGGSIGIPLATIAPGGISMAPPADFAAAKAAYEAKDYTKALTSAKAVATKYRGLPTDWAQQAASLVGDIYVSLNRLPEAEAAYLDFQKIYGGQGSIQSAVGLARIAVSKKDYKGARERLEPITTKALSEKSPAPSVAPAYSQAFYLMGQIDEAEQNYPSALENYLRTVTLFYQDRPSADAAQARADDLRKKDPTLTVP